MLQAYEIADRNNPKCRMTIAICLRLEKGGAAKLPRIVNPNQLKDDLGTELDIPIAVPVSIDERIGRYVHVAFVHIEVGVVEKVIGFEP